MRLTSDNARRELQHWSHISTLQNKSKRNNVFCRRRSKVVTCFLRLGQGYAGGRSLPVFFTFARSEAQSRVHILLLFYGLRFYVIYVTISWKTSAVSTTDYTYIVSSRHATQIALLVTLPPQKKNRVQFLVLSSTTAGKRPKGSPPYHLAQQAGPSSRLQTTSGASLVVRSLSSSRS